MKISIICPCYNSEKYLSEGLASVTAQTYSNFELIIINDGSTDGSAKIAEEYKRFDSRIKLISQKNSGKPSIARNVGIRVSSGDLVTFLDADDVFEPSRLEEIVYAFELNPDCSIVTHDYRRLSKDGLCLSRGIIRDKWLKYNMDKLFMKRDTVLVSQQDLYNYMLDNWFFIHTSTIAIRVADYEKNELLFDESLVYYEDINKWCELVVNRKVIFLDKVLSSYRKTPGSLMSNTLASDMAGVDFYRRHQRAPLTSISKETSSNIERKLIKELKDAIYSATEKGEILLTIRLAYQLIIAQLNFAAIINFPRSVLKSILISLSSKVNK